MKILFKKIIRKAFGVISGLTKKKNPEYLLRKYIDLHNKAYEQISSLVSILNNGIHPKHRIMNYHQFFIDNITDEDYILDLGCGNGFLSYDIAQKAKFVTGIDIMPANIESANKNYRKDNLKFIAADATSYNFGKKIDKIILSNVLEHVENRVDFLKKLHEISDTILLRVPLITRDWLSTYKKELGMEYRLDKTHFIEHTPEELKKELESSGWKIEKYQINWGELWGVAKKL